MLHYDLNAPWRELSLVVLDVETTGLDPASSRVMEVGMVRYERGEMVERWGTLLNPGVPIPQEVQNVTHITPDMLDGKPRFREVAWEVYGRLRDRVLLAYNLSFDQGFLHAELARAGISMPELPGLDPLIWARALMPNERSRKLEVICEKLGIDLRSAHRAVEDAEATGKVAFRLGEKLPASLGDLLKQQATWSAEQEKAFQEKRAAKKGTPPNPAPPAIAPVKQRGLF